MLALLMGTDRQCEASPEMDREVVKIFHFLLMHGVAVIITEWPFHLALATFSGTISGATTKRAFFEE